MLQNKIFFSVNVVLVLVISIILIGYLTPDYHPNGGLQLKLSKDEIDVASEGFIKSFKPELANKIKVISFESNPTILRWLRNTYRLDEANKKIREQKLSYFWSVKFLTDSDSNVVITGDQQRNVNSNTIAELKLSQDGKVIGYSETFNENKVTNYLNTDSAKNYLEQFINKISGYVSFTKDSLKILKQNNLFVLDKIEEIQKPDRKDYNFSWKGTDESGKLVYLKAILIGDRFKSFEITLPIPEEFNKSENSIYEIVTFIFLFFFSLIMTIVIGLRRIKSYEIGYKNAIGLGLIIFILFVLSQLLALNFEFKSDFFVGITFGGVFISLAAIALWAVGETYLREVWNDKFSTFDLLRHKFFMHSIVGKTVIVSVTAGIFLTTIYLVVIRLVSDYFNLNFIGKSFVTVSHITTDHPLIYLFSYNFSSYLLLILPLIFFISGSLKRLVNDKFIFIILNSLAYTILIYLFIEPIYASLIVSFIISLILSFLIYEFDIITAILSFILFNFYMNILEFNFIGNYTYSHIWNLTLIFSGIFIAIGFITIFTKDGEIDINSLAPKYLENITERQRLKKELEVAKIVQMSFLPKQNPKIKNVQIASVCIPAFEVGGDYYDFIKLSENKIGITIGDVSGKGTQAAFYMTLAKGFLKAIAKNFDSPSEVLSRMNELFYENVERGRFISMIYAVLDMENRTMKIARAGHNPVLISQHSSDITLVTPKGLALGLEKGLIFNQVISEETITLERGSTFVFYTDGFTEAVNSKSEEFGLERIKQIIDKYSFESAENLLGILQSEVKKFIGKTHQHDDMTMIIVKII